MKNIFFISIIFSLTIYCSSIPKNQASDRQSVKDGNFLMKESVRVEKLNQIDQALIMATAAYEKYTITDDLSGKSSAAWQMARLYLLKGNKQTAEEWKNNSWRLSAENKDSGKTLEIVRQSEWFWLNGKPDSVLIYAKSNKEMSDSDVLQVVTWRILSNDKIGKFNAGNMEILEKLVSDGYDDFNDGEFENPVILSSAIYSIGYVYYGQNKYEKAKSYYQMAYKIDQEIENPVGLAADLRGMAFSARKLNLTEESKGYLFRCIEIYKTIDMKNEAEELTKKYKSWF